MISRYSIHKYQYIHQHTYQYIHQHMLIKIDNNFGEIHIRNRW